MRKVVVQQFVTLDGYAAGPNGELDFVNETGAAADPTWARSSSTSSPSSRASTRSSSAP